MSLRRSLVVAALVAVSVGAAVARRAAPAAPLIDVTVHEGTSMSVAVSPDGRTLAIDLQGSIWTLPAAGGPAKRITDVFNDARQPAWSPDGKWIAFFGYRDGGYDLWAVAPDGTQPAQADLGHVRRSRAGLVARRHAHRLLVRSRQSARQRLQHLDARRRERRAAPADEGADRGLHADVVAGRQGDRVRVDARERAVGVGRHGRRRHRAQGDDRGRPRRRAVVGTGRRPRLSRDHRRPRRRRQWCRGVALRAGGQRAHRRAKTCSRSARRSGVARPTFYYVSDGKIRKRSVGGGDAQTIRSRRRCR